MLSMRTLGLLRGGILKRMNRFKESRETTEYSKHTGQPVAVTNDRKVESLFETKSK